MREDLEDFDDFEDFNTRRDPPGASANHVWERAPLQASLRFLFSSAYEYRLQSIIDNNTRMIGPEAHLRVRTPPSNAIVISPL